MHECMHACCRGVTVRVSLHECALHVGARVYLCIGVCMFVCLSTLLYGSGGVKVSVFCVSVCLVKFMCPCVDVRHWCVHQADAPMSVCM
jgi:hypothetical protein